MTLEATCTWGDGPDVLMVLEDDGNGDWFMAYEDPHHPTPPQGDSTHGYIRKGSLCLTAAQAESLGYQLIGAAKQARELIKSYAEHCEARHKAQIESDIEKTIERKNIECMNCGGPHRAIECDKPYLSPCSCCGGSHSIAECPEA